MSHRDRENQHQPHSHESGGEVTAHPGKIASLAYAIWESKGRPEGTHTQDWFEAERRLRESGGDFSRTHHEISEQSREAAESRQAHVDGPSIRDRMVSIGRGNQQAGRQGQ